MDEKSEENTVVKNKGHKKNMALKTPVKYANGQKEATEASKNPAVVKKRSAVNKVNSAIRKELTPLMSDYIRECLVKPADGEGTPYFKAYVEAFLQDALDDPSGRCSQQLSSGIFNEALFKTLDSAIQQSGNTEEKAEFLEYKILKTLYKEQREVFEDPSRYRMCICSRRVGKSELAARMLLADALKPNHHGLYIAPLFEQAIGIGMKKVSELADKFKIEYRMSKIEGKITFSNGSDIVFKGNSKRGEADKYQGYLYSLCIVDEVQSQVCLDYLLNSILGAAMVDIKGSKQLLIGTPPRIPNTYCEKLWKMKDNIYSKYNWNMSKNPYLQNDVEAEIDIACRKAGVTRDSTFIQREYYGKFAYDTEALIFKNYRTYEEIPSDFIPTKMWVGVDWGYVDHNAIVVAAVDYYNKKAYVIDQQDFGHVDTDEQERCVYAAYYKAIEFLKKYRIPDAEHQVTIVADTNQPATILKLQRAGLPIIPAEKPDVLSSTEQLATEMRTRLYIPTSGILSEECTKTLWKRDDDGRILGEIDDKTFHPNALHALRYANIMWTGDWLNYEPGHMQEVNRDDGIFAGLNNETPEFEAISVEEEF